MVSKEYLRAWKWEPTDSPNFNRIWVITIWKYSLGCKNRASFEIWISITRKPKRFVILFPNTIGLHILEQILQGWGTIVVMSKAIGSYSRFSNLPSISNRYDEIQKICDTRPEIFILLKLGLGPSENPYFPV